MAYPILKPNSSWFTPTTSSVKRDTITTINIVDSYTPSTTPTNSWDASVAQDGSIMCYVEGTILTIAGKASQIDLDNTDARVNELSANVEEVKENILPTVSNADNGKILAVVNGIWTAVSLINSEEVSY